MPRYALEFVSAALRELDPSAGDEVFDGLRHEYFPRRGERGDSSADVNGEPADLLAVSFALASVQAAPHLEPLGRRLLHDPVRTPDGPSRPVKRGEEPVTGGVDLDSSKDRELAPHGASVFRKQLSPSAVADLNGSLGGADDVREEHGREHTVVHACSTWGG
jgi:hypothetical protein